MKSRHRWFVFLIAMVISAAVVNKCTMAFADDSWHGLTEWTPHDDNPVLTSGPPGSWDEHIRERMAILYDNGTFKAWYGGWQGTYDKNVPNQVRMGYATSPDGVHWTKHPTPVYTGTWTEDLFVLKSGDTYRMYVEDESNNTCHIDLLLSTNGLDWTRYGAVLEHPDGWLGNPVVWQEPSQWYMLFEDAPAVIKLVTSPDGINWQPQSEAVTTDIPGAVGPSSIIKRDDTYFLFFSQSLSERWSDGIAQSTDLIHWTPYSGNPLLSGDLTSAVLVDTPAQYMLYGWNDESNTAGGSQYSLYTSAKHTPEPGAVAILITGLIAMLGYVWSKRK